MVGSDGRCVAGAGPGGLSGPPRDRSGRQCGTSTTRAASGCPSIAAPPGPGRTWCSSATSAAGGGWCGWCTRSSPSRRCVRRCGARRSGWSARTPSASEELEMTVLCLRILQAALVYINTLMLQDVLAGPEWSELLKPADRRGLTPLFWQHVQPYGEVRLDVAKRLPLGGQTQTTQAGAAQ
ncbi:Tn3 family transposase [Spirillospora sp. NPDC049024]